MEQFKLRSDYKMSPEQSKATKKLLTSLKTEKDTVLLGATGTGKTFTIANVIEMNKKPTLVIAHNKSLAGQLYYEFKKFFPDNRVEYYISNFDYYRPEAFIATTQTYIEKQSQQNWEIEMMRNSALSSLTSRGDVIVVASVAAIYGHRDPKEYVKFHYDVRVNEKIDRDDLLTKLVEMGYKRELSLSPGTFTVKGDVIEVSPSWTSFFHIRIELFGDEIEGIIEIDSMTKEVYKRYQSYVLYPASANVVSEYKIQKAIEQIKIDLKKRIIELNSEGKDLEAQRLEARTNFDIEQLQETGTTNGIENYSLYFDDFRKTGEPPFTLLDYFPKDFLLILDESHMTVPQLNGMYAGDRSRKKNLVDYGFRLPSAMDNRPLKFEEFVRKVNKTIYVSATPGPYELEKVHNKVVEQIIRPTGLLDPIIEVRDSENQINDLYDEIIKRKMKNERVLINTVSRKLAEDIADHYKDKNLSVAYLHYELKTFERDEVLRKLRIGFYDAVVGINLLREGLDLPEVSLMAIFDADVEGFLRNKTSLIQMVGRVARNVHGKAIFYGSKVTKSMKEAIAETDRRRSIQEKFNEKNRITPVSIVKAIPEPLIHELADAQQLKLSKLQRKDKIKLLKEEMELAARNYEFEKAIKLRDLIIELEK